MAAFICAWVFLLAMLSWDIYCYPLGVSKLNPQQPVPKREPDYYQPSAPAPVYSSSAYSAPPGYSSSSSPSVEKFAPGPAPSGPSQPGYPQDPWAVEPPSPPSHHFSSSSPGSFGPPESEFQPGEMIDFERSAEHGDYETETEELAFQPPPPPPPGFQGAAGPESFIGQFEPALPPPPGLYWYPYDYMFLTGQYPPGTVTHSSSSFEQGRNHWHDAHYVRDSVPLVSSADQQLQTSPSDFVYPQSLQQSVQSPANAGYDQNEPEAGAPYGPSWGWM